MSRRVLVGLIDSGCSPAQASRVVASRRFVEADDAYHARAAGPDQLGHGAALTAVIAEGCASAQFCVAQVFGDRLVTSAGQVADAIDWLIEQRVEVINMSLGLAADRAVLAAACARAEAAGVVLCAAAPARGAPVFPAFYPGVLRMTGDARCAPGEHSHLDTAHADFGAHVHSGVPSVVGASAGCAHMSAKVAELLAAGVAASRVRDTLCAAARYFGRERRSA